MTKPDPYIVSRVKLARRQRVAERVCWLVLGLVALLAAYHVFSLSAQAGGAA